LQVSTLFLIHFILFSTLCREESCLPVKGNSFSFVLVLFCIDLKVYKITNNKFFQKLEYCGESREGGRCEDDGYMATMTAAWMAALRAMDGCTMAASG
jgi:hypothetical protein